MTKFCPNCGNKMGDNAKFCEGCGTELSDLTSGGVRVHDSVVQRSQVGAASVGNVNISPIIAPTLEVKKEDSQLSHRSAKRYGFIGLIFIVVLGFGLYAGFCSGVFPIKTTSVAPPESSVPPHAPSVMPTASPESEFGMFAVTNNGSAHISGTGGELAITEGELCANETTASCYAKNVSFIPTGMAGNFSWGAKQN